MSENIKQPSITNKNIASRQEIKQIPKKHLKRITYKDCVELCAYIIENPSITTLLVKTFKKKPYDEFLRKNPTKITTETKTINDKKVTSYYLNEEVIDVIKQNINKTLENINSSIKELNEDDALSYRKRNGEDIYLVNEYTTFQDIREKINKEDEDMTFEYDFKNHKDKQRHFVTKTTTQVVDVYINTQGEKFDYPVKYNYHCPECDTTCTREEYLMASTKLKLKCPGMIQTENQKGEMITKKCSTQITPDMTKTIIKEAYVYGISMEQENGEDISCEAISFKKLPKGPLTVALQKITKPYEKPFVYIVDYEEHEQKQFVIPERKNDEHYIFTLINEIDNYIQQQTGYKQWGYLPMKIAAIIQLYARYSKYKNNYHISLIGEMSSGKSAFAKYWSTALYTHNSWQSNATSISIPKLRGTMETFTLFSKDHRYLYRGLLGEMDLIVIDEVKESPDVQNNLKQYLLESDYDYSKQGGNNHSYKRTAQVIVTQNVDLKHIDRYSRKIKDLYQSDSLVFKGEENEPKPAWDYSIDLTLPLYTYTNHYLRYAIRKIRDEYERQQVNWIDGSELALKQRFFFYFYLGSKKSSRDLTMTVRKNKMGKTVDNLTELKRHLNLDTLKEKIKNIKDEILWANNDVGFFDNVQKVLKQYGKRVDTRTQEMAENILDILRIIDDREMFIEEDLNILRYIIENIDSKIEVADTNEYKILGHIENNDEDKVKESTTSDEWGYAEDSELNNYL